MFAQKVSDYYFISIHWLVIRWIGVSFYWLFDLLDARWYDLLIICIMLTVSIILIILKENERFPECPFIWSRKYVSFCWKEYLSLDIIVTIKKSINQYEICNGTVNQASKQYIIYAISKRTKSINWLTNANMHLWQKSKFQSINQPINQSIKLQTNNLGKRIYMSIGIFMLCR